MSRTLNDTPQSLPSLSYATPIEKRNFVASFGSKVHYAFSRDRGIGRLLLCCGIAFVALWGISVYQGKDAISQNNGLQDSRIQNNSYYVATTGADSNPGTEEEPFGTISKAVSMAGPGDTILVRGGTYREVVYVGKSGTEGNPIRIAAFPGEQPILDGEYSLPGGEAWDCADVSPFHCYVFTPMITLAGKYLELDGFTVIRSRGRGIDVSAPSFNQRSSVQHVKVSNCVVRGARELGIGIIYAEHVIVENCDVSDAANYATHDRHYSTDNWPGIVTIVGANEVVVRGTTIYESWGEGLIADRGSTNVLIEDNVVYDNYALQIYVHRAQNVVVQRNLTYHTNNPLFFRGREPSPCIVLENESDFSGMISTKNVKVLNNVAVGCNSLISMWGNDGGGEVTEDVEIAHNIMVNGFRNSALDRAKALFVRPGMPYKNIDIHNNIIVQDNGGTIAEVSDSDEVNIFNNFWSQSPPASAASSGDFIGDPQLDNPYASLIAGEVTVDWYKPIDSSPAIALNMGPYEYLNQEAPEAPQPVPTPQPNEPEPEVPTATPTSIPEPELPTPTPVPDTPTSTLPPNDDSNDGALPKPVVVYNFNEAEGKWVYDRSGSGQPLDLEISDPNAIAWVDGGLSINSPVILRSQANTSTLFDSCLASNELTIEAWLEPANLTQEGPARIISMSGDTVSRNFTLGQGLWSGQPSDLYNVRLRTNQTDLNGEPSLSTDASMARMSQSHVVFVYDEAGGHLYLDGQKVASSELEGSFSNWDQSFDLLIANESTGDRPWLGTLYHVALYCDALIAADVEENYSRGAELPGFSDENPESDTGAPTDPDTDNPIELPAPPLTTPVAEVPDFLESIFMPFVMR